MKILITNDGPTANKFIRLGYARAFDASGHEVLIHDLGQKPIFDVFDEFNPDLLMTQTYNVTKSMAKCIEERPGMKVVMKGSDYGEAQKNIDLKEFPVLVANEKEIEIIGNLYEKTGKPDLIHGHYHPNRIGQTHGFWEKICDRVCGLMSAADIFDFCGGSPKEAFKCDIGYVGGYWGYKARSLDRYFLPLCNVDRPYHVKIFGNQAWGVPQYCGNLDDKHVKDFLASAVVCPNVSEPHSQVFGYDIVERPWKLLSNRCFCVSDYVESMAEDVFRNDELIMAKTPEEFEHQILHFLKYPDERLPYIERGYEKVMSGETYFHRAASVMQALHLPWEYKKIIESYKQIREAL